MHRKEYISRMADLWKRCMHMERYENIRLKLIYLTSLSRKQEKMVELAENIVALYENDEEMLERVLIRKLKEVRPDRHTDG